ncbi:MAG: hypothetical protein ACJZ70_00600 [Limisphaerales bacterium]
MRLKHAENQTQINAICGTISRTTAPFSVSDGDNSNNSLSISITKAIASITFITGPAIEMNISSRLRLERFEGLTGTGLAQPKKAIPKAVGARVH